MTPAPAPASDAGRPTQSPETSSAPPRTARRISANSLGGREPEGRAKGKTGQPSAAALGSGAPPGASAAAARSAAFSAARSSAVATAPGPLAAGVGALIPRPRNWVSTRTLGTLPFWRACLARKTSCIILLLYDQSEGRLSPVNQKVAAPLESGGPARARAARSRHPPALAPSFGRVAQASAQPSPHAAVPTPELAAVASSMYRPTPPSPLAHGMRSLMPAPRILLPSAREPECARRSPPALVFERGGSVPRPPPLQAQQPAPLRAPGRA
jgi:hypothetical protein